MDVNNGEVLSLVSFQILILIKEKILLIKIILIKLLKVFMN